MGKLFLQSVFAGILIGLGGFAYLSNPVIGTFLFAFGLAAVVLYKLPLYTGTVGFIDLRSVNEYIKLWIILLGNILGAMMASTIAICGSEVIQESATRIIENRVSIGFLRCFMLAIGCGVVMSAAVEAAKSGNTFTRWIPLLFGIPLFISCGMVHSIADLFYFFVADVDVTVSLPYVLCWAFAVLGNALGCNMYRIFLANKITE